MRKIIFLSLLMVGISCVGKTRKSVTIAVAKNHDNATKHLSCDEKLKQLVLSCANFKTLFNRKTMCAEIEEKRQNGVYSIRLYAKEHGANSESTQGWLLLDTKNRLLKDVTFDPEAPIILRYDEGKYEDYVANCLGIKGFSAKHGSVEDLLHQLPMLPLPLEYSYDFIMDMGGTAVPDKALMPLLESCVDSETDLMDCHVAQLLTVDGYRVFIICGRDQIGEGRFFLCSLDKNNKLTDKLLIYMARTIRWKGKEDNSYLHFKINDGGQITLHKTVIHNEKELVIGSKHYQLKGGKFCGL